MRRLAVALRCPDCGAAAELGALLTDQGLLVARATLAAHLEQAHGRANEQAQALVAELTWKCSPAPLHAVH